MQIAVNGRYQVHQMTGMQRYAQSIVQRIAEHCRVVAPNSNVRGVRGHAWEQWALAKQVNGELLWSPCSTGPLSVRNQVVTIHDCAFVDQAECFSRLFARWYQWLVPRLARKARRIIAVSEFSKQRVADYCHVDEGKIDVVYNGVDERYTPQDAGTVECTLARLQIATPYVLCVGSLEPRKNLRRLLEAWSTMHHLYEGLTLVLCGGRTNVFEDAGIASLPPRVHLTGYLDDDDLPAVYSGAEVFVFPSIYEGFGLPVAEAMACGTPVVCSNVTALPEVAGDAAEYLDPLDVESIAHALRRLLDDSKRRQMLVAKGLNQSRQFQWDTAAEQTLAILANQINDA